ncbi:anaphase promoting complex subunit 5 ida isoform X2 [Oratosquilla oratoria]|uniref:anaphase promoting complex subunit 5 ida isoform X2 n=1 Tax=Oratosquilla oratoria TaxID=337810 RepID=UPI003F75B2F9
MCRDWVAMSSRDIFNLPGSGGRERDTVTPHKIAVILYIEKYARLRPKYWEPRPHVDCEHDISPRQRKATSLMTVRLIQGSDMKLKELLDVVNDSELLPQHVTTFMSALHEMYCSGVDKLLTLFETVEKFTTQDNCLWTSVVGLYLRRMILAFRWLSFSRVTRLYQSFQDYYKECYGQDILPSCPPSSANQPKFIQPLVKLMNQLDGANMMDDTSYDIQMEDVTHGDEENTQSISENLPNMAENIGDMTEGNILGNISGNIAENSILGNVAENLGSAAAETSLSENADMTVCSAEIMAITQRQDNESSEQVPSGLLNSDGQLDESNINEQLGKTVNRSTGQLDGAANVSTVHSSRQQAELFIGQQTALLQFNEAAALTPQQLQESIRLLLKQNPDLAEAHYLSYLNCVRVKEYNGALHSLLRSYDRALLHRDTSRAEDHSKGFRYAALNLAALHAQFGHKKEGVAALQEAIRLAQESSDHVCLQHALAWLYTLLPNQKITLMKRSFVKSSELSLSYLSSLGMLNHVSQLAQTQATPAQLLQSILRAEAVNCQHSLVSLQHGAWGLRAALWTLWGNATMNALCSQLLLQLNTHHTTAPSIYYAAQPTCAAICNVAMLLASRGDYQLAGEVLQHAREQFPSHNQHADLWMFAEAHMTLSDHLHQGHWTLAQCTINSMATTQPIHAQYRECELMVAKGELTRASQLLGKLQKKEDLNVDLQVKLLLLESELLVISGSSTTALPILVEALALADKHHLHYLAALTRLHLANVQLQLGLVQEAKDSVEGGLSVVLSNGSVYDQARARLVTAKLQISDAKGNERKAKLLTAARSLDLVQQLFEKVKAFHRVRDALYLKTRLYQEVGFSEERNKSAYEFRQLEQQNPCLSFQPSVYSF